MASMNQPAAEQEPALVPPSEWHMKLASCLQETVKQNVVRDLIMSILGWCAFLPDKVKSLLYLVHEV
jgi:hypothetical protein